MNDQLRNAALLSVVRHLLVAGAGLWSFKFSETEASEIAGVVVALVGIVWAVVDKHKSIQKVQAAEETASVAVEKMEKARSETDVLKRVVEGGKLTMP